MCAGSAGTVVSLLLGLTAVATIRPIAAALCWASLDIVTASTIPEQFEGTVCTCGTLCFTALTCGFSPTLLRFVNRCLSLVKHLPMLTCAGVLSCAGGILYFWHSSHVSTCRGHLPVPHCHPQQHTRTPVGHFKGPRGRYSSWRRGQCSSQQKERGKTVEGFAFVLIDGL